MNARWQIISKFSHPVSLKICLLGAAFILTTPGIAQVADLNTTQPFNTVSKTAPAPPKLTDWSAPIQDPLHAKPAVLDTVMAHPANLFNEYNIFCATADYVTQTDNPTIAALRLLEKTGNNTGHNPKELELTLLLALDLGLCHNPDIRTTWSEIRIQAAAVGQARSAYLPKFTGTLTRQRSDTRYRDSKTNSVINTSGYISLNWRLLDFGGRRSALNSAYFQLAAAIYNQNATLQDVIIQIVQAYYDAQTAHATVLARQKITALAQQTLASAQRRAAKGVGSQNDVYQAQTSLASAKLEQTQSEGDYKKKIAQLTYLIGLPANTRYTLAETLQEEMINLQKPQEKEKQKQFIQQALQDWLDQAKAHHPAIASARYKWQAAISNIDSARAQGKPTVDIYANYYRNGRPTESASRTKSSEHNIALSITFPLFSGFEHTYKVRGAQAQAQAQRHQMEKVEQQTMLEIVSAYSDAQSAWESLDVAADLYTAASLASQSAQRQFDKGVGDITQVIQAQNNLAQADLQRISAQARWQAAKLILLVQGYAWDRK